MMVQNISGFSTIKTNIKNSKPDCLRFKEAEVRKTALKVDSLQNIAEGNFRKFFFILL